MSYMTENKAHKFYEGVPPPEDVVQEKKKLGEEDDQASDMNQRVINYCII